MRLYRRSPGAIRILLAGIALLTVWLAINAIYQVIRKPSELFFPVSGTLAKTPRETWRNYAPLFRAHAMAVITPEFLAALAQTEGAGNPVARTYWRWTWHIRPFDIYRPASTSVGMYQMTDGTFAAAKQLCIHHHTVAHAGASGDSCGSNDLYFRVIPSHAVELTSAYLDTQMTAILVHRRRLAASAQQKRHLAAAIHLCGAGAADLYAQRGFHFASGQRCGDHDPRDYLRRVDALQAVFTRLSTESSPLGGAR